MRTKWNPWIVVAVVFIGIALWGGSSEKLFAESPKELAIATASSGGAWFPIGAGMSEVIKRAVPGVQARVQTTGGGVENVKLVHDGKVEIGITISYLAYNGYNGIDPYKNKMQNIRTLFSGLSTGVMQVVVPAGSKIKSLADLKGKKVAVGPAGGGALTVLSDIFQEFGFTMSNITPSYVAYDEGVMMMTDGHIDAAVVYAAMPTPAIKTLATGPHAFRMLDLEEKMQKTLLAKYPYYVPITIKKTVYNTGADVRVVGTPNIVIVSSKLPDDLVYKITKASFEPAGLEMIRNSHPSAKALTLEKAALAAVPLHPGAEKFFREKGILK
ncbi:MAG: TAXI family TRAP transporter solute-binding subunit [Deltaproteobacteria bacterium]|nr:TAXI family TRAP transporter solute-binding subunit [Deltaproteobacteria bacterium]